VWGGLVGWLLMGHWFTAKKRREVSSCIHRGNAARASVVGFVAGRGCCDVEELVPVGGGMWSTMMVSRFVVASNG